MNTLKKGDKCQSPWGVVEIKENQSNSELITIMTDRGLIAISELTRIPTHAERMQEVIGIGFNAENTLDENDTVSLKVGQLADFVRHYCELCQALVDHEIEALSHADILRQQSKKIVRILKGEP